MGQSFCWNHHTKITVRGIIRELWIRYRGVVFQFSGKSPTHQVIKGFAVFLQRSHWKIANFSFCFLFLNNVLRIGGFNLSYNVRYLCSERALKGKDDSCLKEKGDNGQIEEKKSKRKTKKNSSKTEDTEKPKNAKEELWFSPLNFDANCALFLKVRISVIFHFLLQFSLKSCHNFK